MPSGLDLVALMPALFVLIWSTGFIVARLGMPHAPPMTFLCWRYALSLLGLALWAWWARAPWPHTPRAWLHLAITGVLLQAGYLGGVWSAVKMGLSAGTTALIVCLQPVLTAIFLEWQGGRGRVRPLQWMGLACGLAGVLVVVWDKLGLGEAHVLNLGLAVLALLSITAGTLYQKLHVGPTDVRSAGAVQMGAALVITLPLALLETEGMDWHPELVIALAWSVLALTMGASSLLYLLIQRGAAMKVASLFYLVPPCTALMAWALFGEPLSWGLLVGLTLAAIGVGLVQRSP
ncbi:MAG: DMT family transporter [Betaproteobacteria bacterium]